MILELSLIVNGNDEKLDIGENSEIFWEYIKDVYFEAEMTRELSDPICQISLGRYGNVDSVEDCVSALGHVLNTEVEGYPSYSEICEIFDIKDKIEIEYHRLAEMMKS